MMRWSALGSVLVVGMVAGALGCQGTRGEVGEPGALVLGVTLPPGYTVLTVHYQITGNGIPPIAGDIDVANPGATPSTAIGFIPAGSNYLVTMTASSTDGKWSCSGSGHFDIVAGATSSVAVALNCRTPSDRGGAEVVVTFDNCPQITALSAAPRQASVGGHIHLTATASDPDGPAPTLAWAAPLGTFADPTAASTTYTCTAAGNVDLTLTASDGACQDQVVAPVVCVPFCAVHGDGTPCDDEDACTTVDACLGGVCVGGSPVVCGAPLTCHAPGVCDPMTGACSDPFEPDGTTCSLANATAACASGDCGILACNANFGDCDLAPADGCEVPLLDTPAHCGSCAFACASGASCVGGLCFAPPPSGVTATAAGWSVSVAWSASPSASGYQILRGPAPAGPFTPIGATTATTFLDDAIVTGTAYAYVVEALSPAGTSAASTAATATPSVAKQICVTRTPPASIVAYAASQSGAAVPVRSIAGAMTGFGAPSGIASSLAPAELYVSLVGGNVPVFPLAASGNVAPSRLLTGAAGGVTFNALAVDAVAGEIYTAEFETGGRLVTLDATTGVQKRAVTGAATLIGHPRSVIVDRAHGELILGQLDPTSAFQQILVFNTGDSGNVAPKRVLGAAGGQVGAYGVVLDLVHDELVTANNTNNKITVFNRTDTAGAPPKRTITLTGSITVFSMLLDPGADTLWVIGRSGFSTQSLVEIPRGASGSVSPLHPAITMSVMGELARCN